MYLFVPPPRLGIRVVSDLNSNFASVSPLTQKTSHLRARWNHFKITE
jgi:hypothetical protein